MQLAAVDILINIVTLIIGCLLVMLKSKTMFVVPVMTILLVTSLGANAANAYLKEVELGNPLEIALGRAYGDQEYKITDSEWDEFIQQFGSLNTFKTVVYPAYPSSVSEKSITIYYKWKTSTKKFNYIIDFWYENDKGEEVDVYTFKSNDSIDSWKLLKEHEVKTE